MTVDFGFVSSADAAPPNAITLSGMSVDGGSSVIWALGLLAIGLMGLAVYLWQRRRAM